MMCIAADYLFKTMTPTCALVAQLSYLINILYRYYLMLHDDADIKSLSYSYQIQESQLPNKLPKHRPGEQFLKGPIPLDWLEKAALLPSKAFLVGIILWYLAGIKKQRTIPISNSITKRFGIGRSTKYRALKALECAGLVSICHQPGRSPLVTILGIHEEKWQMKR